jgi:deoxycytidylate deaminase
MAALEAKKSTHHKYKIGCIIVNGNQVLGKGCNNIKTHPRWGRNGWNILHAETTAIVDAERRGNDISGCSAYIYRVGGKLARPCDNCHQAMQEKGIKNIYYSTG